jgi:hypothetical protein
MLTAKEDALRIVGQLPDEATLEDIQYHLYVLQKVENARQAIDRGDVLSQEEVERRMERWLTR